MLLKLENGNVVSVAMKYDHACIMIFLTAFIYSVLNF